MSPSTPPAPGHGNAKRLMQLIALALVAVGAVAVMFLPLYASESLDSDGTAVSGSQTVWDVNGPVFLLVMAIPLAIALAPVLARGRAWQPVSVISAVLLGLFALAGLLSIGVFFLPAVIAEVVAACLPSRPRRAAAARGILSPARLVP